MTTFLFTMLALFGLSFARNLWAPIIVNRTETQRVYRCMVDLVCILWCVILLTACGDGGEAANICTKNCAPTNPPSIEGGKP